jgi:hypothetical protein
VTWLDRDILTAMHWLALGMCGVVLVDMLRQRVYSLAFVLLLLVVGSVLTG